MKMKRYKKALPLWLFLFLTLLGTGNSYAQRVSLSTNVLEWAVATPNLGAEFTLREHWSLNVSLSAAPWKMSKTFYAKEFRFQPELRYWFNQSQAGLYTGLTAYYASFDLGLKKKAYYGDAMAAGLTCGYSWILSRRWNFEVSGGIAVAYTRYRGYVPGVPHGEPDCERLLPAPAKLAVSFIYVLR